MSNHTQPFSPPVPFPAMERGRKIENFEVRVPSPLEVDEMRNYPREVMRAVALAANEAGLSGKRLDGFAMVENGGMSPRIVFQVSSDPEEQRCHECCHLCDETCLTAEKLEPALAEFEKMNSEREAHRVG